MVPTSTPISRRTQIRAARRALGAPYPLGACPFSTCLFGRCFRHRHPVPSERPSRLAMASNWLLAVELGFAAIAAIAGLHQLLPYISGIVVGEAVLRRVEGR